MIVVKRKICNQHLRSLFRIKFIFGKLNASQIRDVLFFFSSKAESAQAPPILQTYMISFWLRVTTNTKIWQRCTYRDSIRLMAPPPIELGLSTWACIAVCRTQAAILEWACLFRCASLFPCFAMHWFNGCCANDICLELHSAISAAWPNHLYAFIS